MKPEKKAKTIIKSISLQEIRDNMKEAAESGVPITDTVKIHPEVAKAILKELNTNNRPIRPLAVNRYAAAIADGAWVISDIITFNKEGALENGQHRLKAIAQSGQVVTTMIAFGVDHNVSLDRPVVRSISDNGKMYDHQEYNKQYLSALQSIYRIAIGTNMNMTDMEVINAYNHTRATIDALIEKIPAKGDSVSVNAAHATALLALALSGNATPDELSATVYTVREGRFADDIENILKPLRDDIIRKSGVFDPRRNVSPARKSMDISFEYMKYYNQFIHEMKRKVSDAAILEMMKDAYQKFNS